MLRQTTLCQINVYIIIICIFLAQISITRKFKRESEMKFSIADAVSNVKVFLPWALLVALAFYHSLYVAENSFKLRQAAYPTQVIGIGC